MLLLDGDVDGVRFLEVANWTGLGVLAPRDRYSEIRREAEYDRTGVYLLLGPDPDNDARTRAYIGRAEKLQTRLDAHAKEKGWWDTCMCFTTSDNSLTLTHIQYLEAALLDQAREAGQVVLDNTQYPDVPDLGRADREDLQRFLEKVLLLAGMAGLPIFDVVDSTPAEQGYGTTATPDEAQFPGVEFSYSGSGNYDASGRFVGHRRFLVTRGSEARSDETGSCPAKVRAVRAKLRDEGILVQRGDKLAFTADHVFNSPSLAAGVVYGGSSNGRTAWSNDEGRTINELDRLDIEAQETDEAEGPLIDEDENNGRPNAEPAATVTALADGTPLDPIQAGEG
ncbi:MAG: GIY-YIG nuclease family protein [Thermoplasmatota archaeon]